MAETESQKLLKDSKLKITEYIGHENKSAYTKAELNDVLSTNSQTWNLVPKITKYQFVKFLLKKHILEQIDIDFSKRREIRYTRNGTSIYALALSLRTNSYLSHKTAAYLNGLYANEPNDIYVNYEQNPKRLIKTELLQEKIDFAFRNSVRVTNCKANLNGKTIWLINGMYTGRNGVKEIKYKDNNIISLTNLERTLIDMSVRPIYSGGISEVLQAYRMAAGNLSINRLATTLNTLGYTYPYHQVIGFYLERAGVYKNDEISIFRNPGINYDFYLTHHMDMNSVSYSENWRLYYPNII
jgi:hypothetical protein